jgi:hypothetical protein
MEVYGDLAEIYLDFARYDAGGFGAIPGVEGGPAEPTTFVTWATAVAADPEVLAWIARLPPIKRQPNLVFAAARWHGVTAPGPYDGLRRALLDDGDDGPIRATILRRATQTNEAGRLATLLPAFAGLVRDRPLALLEVGASAGLCLYPDRWGYDWDTEDGHVLVGDAPRLACRVRGPAPLTGIERPAVAWRGGVDLNPLDVRDADQMAWLEQLVWPEHEDRRTRLRHAIGIARADPPRIVPGDLLEDLPALVEQASAYGDVVVFHSAVIAYLVPEDRLRFDATIRRLVADGACHWVSNEGPNVLSSVTATAPAITPSVATFVLGVDGVARALTHGHGRTMRWLG